MNVRNPNSSGRSSSAIIWIVLAGLAIIAGGFLIATLTPSLLPAQASAQAVEVDELFRFLLTIGGAIFLLVQGVLAFSVVRFRARAGDTSDGPPIHGNTTLEFVWTAIPAVIVLVITIYSYQVWTTTRAPQPNETVAGVVGARFAWTFTYDVAPEDFPADVDIAQLPENVQATLAENGSIQLVSNQFHTYVGQDVRLEMVTEDVIHSFWVPSMRIKQDLLPGRVTEVRFTPIEPGVYRVVCAELCGSGHGDMAGQIVNGNLVGGWVIVHPDEETYRREFLEPETLSVLFPPEDPVELGRQILASGRYPCNTCHTLDDLGWVGTIGPSLNGIGARTQRLDASGHPDMETYLHESIRNPGAYLVPGFGNLMPQFNPEPTQPNYMPEADLEAVVAYLLSQTE
ncbi:MAG: cytochrome c oxidase subunit II [Chloroflexota bacterium]|nr:MAG: cytochrome c oxidase subunit II [Chloroflexota bacterium]